MSKEFLTTQRIKDVYRPVEERKRDYHEVERTITEEEIKRQSARCMDCGVPFCHGTGCPLGNVIPEMNAAVHDGDYKTAFEILNSTSSMPEFTARVCPALCEGSCTASIDYDPVMIRQIEKIIIEKAFENNWVKPRIPCYRTGKTIAIIGSGPAGLAAAIELNDAGHNVTVFERASSFGGLLRYGIPTFKLEKSVIDRRIQVMRESGINFQADTDIGKDIAMEYLARQYDAVVVASGTPTPRDLQIPGREASGIYFALDFLNGTISAEKRHVLIIGGGDTGSDCAGLSLRQGAKSVLQIEIMPEPPEDRSPSTPWPAWPYKQRSSSSHLEGGKRRWNLQSNHFLTEDGRVTGVDVSPVEWTLSPEGRPLSCKPVAGAHETIKADIVFLAMGFLKPTHPHAEPNVFVVGDALNGPSLVVRAIADAKKTVERINSFLE